MLEASRREEPSGVNRSRETGVEAGEMSCGRDRSPAPRATAPARPPAAPHLQCGATRGAAIAAVGALRAAIAGCGSRAAEAPVALPDSGRAYRALGDADR